MSTLTELWNYLATAPTGEITSICVALGFVVLPFVQGAWDFAVWTINRFL